MEILKPAIISFIKIGTNIMHEHAELVSCSAKFHFHKQMACREGLCTRVVGKPKKELAL